MTIRLLLTGRSSIIGQAIRLIFDEVADLVVVTETNISDEQLVTAVDSYRPDVVFDYDTLVNGLLDIGDPIDLLARRNRPRTVLMVGRRQQGLIGPAVRVGINGFVCEDDQPTDLVKAIRSVAAGRAWLSPQLVDPLFDHYRANTVERTRPPQEVVVLSRRERGVIELVAKGRSNSEIATELSVAESTIKTHVSRILRKLALRDRTQLAYFAHQNELV